MFIGVSSIDPTHSLSHPIHPICIARACGSAFELDPQSTGVRRPHPPPINDARRPIRRSNRIVTARTCRPPPPPFAVARINRRRTIGQTPPSADRIPPTSTARHLLPIGASADARSTRVHDGSTPADTRRPTPKPDARERDLDPRTPASRHPKPDARCSLPVRLTLGAHTVDLVPRTPSTSAPRLAPTL